MKNNWLEGLGMASLIVVCLCIIFIPIIAAVVISIALANYFGITGILWWCVVIFITLILWGILGKLFN